MTQLNPAQQQSALSVLQFKRSDHFIKVQTKGSVDSLILNLSKSLKKPVVQGDFVITDAIQIENIKMHTVHMPGLIIKLKYWDHEDVLRVHEALELLYESTNSLGLVPQGFE